MLRLARNQNRVCIRRLEARWAILTRKIDLKIETVPKVINACFVLHDFCDHKKTYTDDDLVKTQIEFDKKNEQEHINFTEPNIL